MYSEIFEQIGLAKNEARIYETLLREGECSVAKIATKSKVHRRNVYDSLKRLLEKGLAFEILQKNENHYQAVDPDKLMEFVHEKERALENVLPELRSLFRSTPHAQEVFIYRGIEGWKNYMRDILRIGEDFYCIGAKGAWMDTRLKNFFPQFIQEAKRKKINYYHLFDHEVKESDHPILKHVGKNYKILPPGYSAPAAIDFFGNYVNIISNIKVGTMDEDFSFTVIINSHIADAFRTWFRFMWDFCPESK